MKKKLLVALGVMSLLFTGAGPAAAQDAVYVPVDLIVCKFNEGRGPADLDAAAAKWNAYMDENGSDAYAAWTGTKHYASADQDFDFFWLGAHRNGITMGEGQDNWHANGGAVLAEFMKVATCHTTGLYDSEMFKAPPAGNVPGGGVLVMQNCKMKEGVTWDQVDAAGKAASKLMTDNGSAAAAYLWYPAYGTGEHEIDYKAVTAYQNHAEFGKDHDRVGNGGLWRDLGEIWGPVETCDVARVYDITLRRTGKIRD